MHSHLYFEHFNLEGFYVGVFHGDKNSEWRNRLKVGESNNKPDCGSKWSTLLQMHNLVITYQTSCLICMLLVRLKYSQGRETKASKCQVCMRMKPMACHPAKDPCSHLIFKNKNIYWWVPSYYYLAQEVNVSPIVQK